VKERRYKEEWSGSGLGKAGCPASKNKHTASSHILSYKHFSHTTSERPLRSKHAKQCHQTPTSHTASQATEARTWSSKSAAAAQVPSSAAATADTTPPLCHTIWNETTWQPRPTPSTPSTSRKAEPLPGAHSHTGSGRSQPMSKSTLYSEPSQRISKPSAHKDLRHSQACRSGPPRAPACSPSTR